MENVRIGNNKFDKEVYDDIHYTMGPEFAKKLVLQTKNDVFYASDLFKSKILNDVLAHNGIKKNEAIIIHAENNYYGTTFDKFYFEPNSNYFYRVNFWIVNKPTGTLNGDPLKIYHYNMIQVYPDKNFFFFNSFEGKYATDVSFYTYCITDESKTHRQTIINRKRIKQYSTSDDVLTRDILPQKAANTYNHLLSSSTRKKLIKFFKDNGVPDVYLTDFPQKAAMFNEFMLKASPVENKVLKTRDKLIVEVFDPMFKKVQKNIGPKAIKKSTEQEKFVQENKEKIVPCTTKGNYWDPIIVRDGDWLMCTNNFGKYGQVIFYNVKKRTKYMCTVTSTNIDSIQVFNLQNIRLYPTNSYGYLPYYMMPDSVFFKYGTSPAKQSLYDTFQYIDTAKMYDINGNEISYKECLAGTNLTSMLEINKDKIYAYSVKRFVVEYENNDYLSYIDKDIIEQVKNANYENNKIENLLKNNRVPIIFFLSLCLKKEYRISAEQLAKSGYLNIFALMINDQNIFSIDGDSSCKKILFDKDGTNLKNCFKLGTNQLKAIDEWLEKRRTNKRSMPIGATRIIFGEEKAKTIDKETNYEYLQLLDRINPDNTNLRRLQEALKSSELKNLLENPKELLTALTKVSDRMLDWIDYLNMRNQLEQMVKRGITNVNIKNYKIIPDKSTKYVTLREKTSPFVWGGAYSYTIESQLRDLHHTYKNVEVVSRTNETIGVILEMTIPETVKYLHDELQEIIKLFKDEAKDVLFDEAVKRVKKYEWSDDKISIIAPKNTSDLVTEGTMLSHCVSSFINPVIDGKENVMFIRRKEVEDCPWYTMAIDNFGNIEQIHNYQNGDLSIESQQYAYEITKYPSYNKQIDLLPILKKWAREKGINVNSVNISYGRLVAHR